MPDDDWALGQNLVDVRNEERRPQYAPDPKPVSRRGNRARRIVDPSAGRAAHAAGDECASCHRPGANAHHVIPRGGRGGDDVAANLVLLCGSGSSRCHGAVHGAGYLDERGRRWTTEDVCRAIGRHLAAARPDTIAYVLGKLGDVAGRDLLFRRYYLELGELD